jgi:hypothetical protein
MECNTSFTMNETEPVITREELQQLSGKYREMKHSINNTFAVIMALSELGQRNPAHLEKLAKAVLQRSPDVVAQLTHFGEMLNALIKGEPMPLAPRPESGTL